MTIPLIALGILSIVGGWIGIPHVIGAILPGHPENYFHHWLQPVIGSVGEIHGSAITEWSLMGVSVSLAVLSACFAYSAYVLSPKMSKAVAEALGPVHTAVANKYYVDEFYFAAIIRPLVNGSKALWYYIDVNLIDKATYFVSDLVAGLASFVKTVQSGNTQNYALYMALGVVVVIAAAMVV